MILKKKLLFFFLLLPSVIFNYLTLTYLDYDSNLSVFSTFFIFLFNFINIFLAFIYYKNNLKIFFIYTLYLIIIFFIFDLSLEKSLNKNSIVEEDDEIGWIIKANTEINFPQQTFKRKKYNAEYRSSAVKGFREFGKLDSKNESILVIGDSLTGGPHASNEKMYYSIIKNIFDDNNINLEWFVTGTGGYGTVQHFLLLEKYFKIIKPSIILHQFCVNDFFDNSIEISKLSTSHDQYYRRPFFDNNKIAKVDSNFAEIYRFLYKHSFVFKKVDQIYTYRRILSLGSFTKKIPDEFISRSINNTQILFLKIRELIGKDTLYFSTNCIDDEYNNLSAEWEKNINAINGFSIKSGKKIVELKKKDFDVNHEDGGHLNELGNKIYGEITAKEMMKIIKIRKY